MQPHIAAILIVLSLSTLIQAQERTAGTAVRVANDTIAIDARDDDWGKFEAKELATDAAVGWGAVYLERGVRTGDDDCSFKIRLAHDDANLYVIANVHDQFLVNTSDDKEPFYGDDFELFIDANPPDKQFAAVRNENSLQLIFVPARINPRWSEIFIWQSDKMPGLRAASRLRPWGYTIEIAVPKAIFPHWKDHPELNAIGFDAMVEDADAPGVDAAHPSIKGVMWLMRQGNHFMTSEGLGRVALAVDVSEQNKIAEIASPEGGAEALLDSTAVDAGNAALKALAAGDAPLRKAALRVLATANLPVDTVKPEGFAKSLRPAPGDTSEDLKYAMMALSKHFELASDNGLFAQYFEHPDLSVRLTALWCTGMEKDKGAVRVLIRQLKSDNLRLRMMAAWALGAIGNKSALVALEKMASSDPHGYGQTQATMAIERINGGK